MQGPEITFGRHGVCAIPSVKLRSILDPGPDEEKDNVVDIERMVRMNSRAIVGTIGLILLLSAALMATPVPYNGKISVDSVQAQPGQSVVVPVRIANNDVAMAGLFVPLHYSSSALIFDSVSFIGTLVDPYMLPTYHGDSAARTIEIYYLPPTDKFPLPVINSVSGVVAKVYFHVAANATQGFVTLDSINEVTNFGSSNYYKRVEVYDSTGSNPGTWLPDFAAGGIDVKVPTGVNDNGNGLPGSFALGQNYPNPFNPTTTIEFALPMASHVKVDVYNILGQSVANLLDKDMPAGTHRVEFDATPYPSGIYFYRWTHVGGSETRKMILVK
jgi:hypothetical protein